MAPASASASPRVELDLSASCTTEDELAQLDALRSENQLLRRFLQRVAPESLLAPVSLVCGRTGAGGILMPWRLPVYSQIVAHCKYNIL